MPPIQHYLTRSDCYRAQRTITPKRIMVHSLGVAQPNVQVFLDTWNVPGKTSCVHAFVHRGGVVQTLPWNWRGWHAGTGSGGKSANNDAISFEICEPAGHTYQGGTMIGYDVEKNAAYFADVYRNAVELTAYLCKLYSLDPLKPGVVICHSEGHAMGIASNHADVMHWFPKHGKNMDMFRADVAAKMKGEEDMTREETQKLINEAVEAAKPKVYTELDKVPKWAQPLVRRAKDEGIIKGDGIGKLNLTDTDLKTLSMVMAATKGGV